MSLQQVKLASQWAESIFERGAKVTHKTEFAKQGVEALGKSKQSNLKRYAQLTLMGGLTSLCEVPFLLQVAASTDSWTSKALLAKSG